MLNYSPRTAPQVPSLRGAGLPTLFEIALEDFVAFIVDSRAVAQQAVSEPEAATR
jgi:hypothetical protein